MRRFGVLPLALAAVIAALGLVTAGAVAGTSPGPDPSEIYGASDVSAANRPIPGNPSPHVAPAFAPQPAPLSVTTPGGELGTSFSGVTFHDQRNADGGNQLSTEPPDQGLCVGNGVLIEAVNDVFATYNAATGDRISTSFESLNEFFFGQHQIDRTVNPPIIGTFISDPRCIYDVGSGRFFLSVLAVGRDPSTGAHQAPGLFLIATSKTGTPTNDPSDWRITSVDVTNDGRSGEPTHPGCPCFGDQPLLGTDANGVYITTNEFPINLATPGFNGAQIYAFQKSALVAGTTPKMQRIEGAPIASTGYDGVPYSLQPTTSPSAGDYVTADNGTEYLVGALDFAKKPFELDNRIAVWALTNTASLNTTPAIHVDDAVISSQVYGLPPTIAQPNGPTPVGDSFHDPENSIDGGDDRMQVAVYAHGRLWAAGDTIVETPTGPAQVGVTYYMVSPAVDSSGAVTASMVKQGYVSVNGDSVTRPSLGVTSSGKVALGVSLIGPDYFPSVAYTTFDDSVGSAPTTLHVAAAGQVPADGLSGYAARGGNGVERWGDYGFAAVDGNSVWVANEWIPGLAQPPDVANWGTRVSKITP
jgi:hypothetical protein